MLINVHEYLEMEQLGKLDETARSHRFTGVLSIPFTRHER